MKQLSASERAYIIGPYHAPEGLYEYTKTLPFLGTVKSNVTRLTAGQWTEILLTYEVGASGLADGAWIKATFKFYSDWALFQTSDRTKPNYISAEYVPRELHPGQNPATIQSLSVRFDQKGHERPFQKAIIVDIVDGYLNPGDKILIRLGDKRYGGEGTRVQTFVESTEDSTYNFTYGRDIAGLDVLGYTANDFQVAKQKWDSTLALIKTLNKPGSFVLFPGTEWCGNSAAGGDHNVVFLADPDTHPPQFPFDKHGNVFRSFEWSEDGPADLVPGAWPLHEVYATYAADSEDHLSIPHVGGRRCNLAWHHPTLERLVEIGSAWGHFEWLLQDAVRRGWKLGVCANSDEHRGRCGGGVPGTAVFGTKGGLTGILASSLDRQSIADALRARHTFATTGPRLVVLVSTDAGQVQGDEVDVSGKVKLYYEFSGIEGFSSIEASDATGRIWHRELWQESGKDRTILRVLWGGARFYDRYREAVWEGRIDLDDDVTITGTTPFGGLRYDPEDEINQSDSHSVLFASRTSGDTDGVHISFAGNLPSSVTIARSIGGYVKVGDALAGNPHKPQPTFSLTADVEELRPGGKRVEIKGGAELFISAELVPDLQLPLEVSGEVEFEGNAGEERAVYFVAREWSGDKVVTSPVFIQYRREVGTRRDCHNHRSVAKAGAFFECKSSLPRPFATHPTPRDTIGTLIQRAPRHAEDKEHRQDLYTIQLFQLTQHAKMSSFSDGVDEATKSVQASAKATLRKQFPYLKDEALEKVMEDNTADPRSRLIGQIEDGIDVSQKALIRGHTALLCVSRQIYEEARTIWYAINTFSFDVGDPLYWPSPFLETKRDMVCPQLVREWLLKIGSSACLVKCISLQLISNCTPQGALCDILAWTYFKDLAGLAVHQALLKSIGLLDEGAASSAFTIQFRSRFPRRTNG
ncbi:hypothetical protein CBER1_09982 [Cercospora berteroae]|uniref:DUF3604 domain-containing protein n=1 Tax=Cercospora berteroae TaxID=357750 RepID=A0A2S6CAW4_9PEZI|nr:hypothetical protein CBER1_09982 [Cercospora berteroae]